MPVKQMLIMVSCLVTVITAHGYTGNALNQTRGINLFIAPYARSFSLMASGFFFYHPWDKVA